MGRAVHRRDAHGLRSLRLPNGPLRPGERCKQFPSIVHPRGSRLCPAVIAPPAAARKRNSTRDLLRSARSYFTHSRVWTLTILARPVAKGRPRLSARAGRVYTPARTRRYEAMIAAEAHAMGVRPAAGPVRVEAIFMFMRPRRSTASVPRPDLDNLVKAVMDGLNGIAWNDDSQVVTIAAEKHFGTKDMVRVTVSAVSDSKEEMPARAMDY
ncbi:MAG: hypothetical protein CFK52_13710 [Chloracidobacterium sp. CP2_5A]|nr:MAG: hypothetical protein CFK52_13710 [Chloracidobacterium sp. CP2_5A]